MLEISAVPWKFNLGRSGTHWKWKHSGFSPWRSLTKTHPICTSRPLNEQSTLRKDIQWACYADAQQGLGVRSPSVALCNPKANSAYLMWKFMLQCMKMLWVLLAHSLRGAPQEKNRAPLSTCFLWCSFSPCEQLGVQSIYQKLREFPCNINVCFKTKQHNLFFFFFFNLSHSEGLTYPLVPACNLKSKLYPAGKGRRQHWDRKSLALEIPAV